MLLLAVLLVLLLAALLVLLLSLLFMWLLVLVHLVALHPYNRTHPSTPLCVPGVSLCVLDYIGDQLVDGKCVPYSDDR